MEEDDITNPEWQLNVENPRLNGDVNHGLVYNFSSPINDWTHSKRLLDVAEHNYQSFHLELHDDENWLEDLQIHKEKIKDVTIENTPNETLNVLTRISYFLHAKYCMLLDRWVQAKKQ